MVIYGYPHMGSNSLRHVALVYYQRRFRVNFDTRSEAAGLGQRVIVSGSLAGLALGPIRQAIARFLVGDLVEK